MEETSTLKSSETFGRRLKIETVFVLLTVLMMIIYNSTTLTLINLPITCLFRYLTGYYCPGCGGTHAFESFMHFRFQESFYYHPVVPVAFGYLFYSWGTYIGNVVSKGRIKPYVITLRNFIYLDAVILAWWLLRNLLITYWGIYLYSSL